jgi:hypothetical protein
MIVQSPGPYPTGLAFDGESLWNVDFQKDTLYKMAYDDGESVYETDARKRTVSFVYRIKNLGPGLVTTAEVFLAVPDEAMVSQKLLGPVSYEPKPDRFDVDESGQKVAIYEYRDLAAGEVREAGYTEYSFLYVALCRAAGLPARFEGSVVVRGDDASVDDVFHRWCEVYLPNYGWVTVDPSGVDSPLRSEQGRAFGVLSNRYFVTTHGGGDSSYLGWNYNYNSRYSFKGAAEVKEEAFAIWEPVE